MIAELSSKQIAEMTPAQQLKHYRSELQNWENRQQLRKANEIRESINVQGCLNLLAGLLQESRTCELAELERLRFQSDIITKILKKALPDLKSIEITENQFKHHRLTIDFSGITPNANERIIDSDDTNVLK